MGRVGARGWWAACALCTVLVLTGSPAHASPTSGMTAGAVSRSALSGEDSPEPSGSSSPSSWSGSSSSRSGGWLGSFLDSCSSPSPECLQAAIADELRSLRSFLTVACSLIVALLGAAVMLLIGRR